MENNINWSNIQNDSNNLKASQFKNVIIVFLLLISIALSIGYYQAKNDLKEFKNIYYQIDTLNSEMQSKIDSMNKVDTIYIEKIKTIHKIKYAKDRILYYCNNADSIYQLFTSYTADTAYWNRYFPSGF